MQHNTVYIPPDLQLELEGVNPPGATAFCPSRNRPAVGFCHYLLACKNRRVFPSHATTFQTAYGGRALSYSSTGGHTSWH